MHLQGRSVELVPIGSLVALKEVTGGKIVPDDLENDAKVHAFVMYWGIVKENDGIVFWISAHYWKLECG